MSVSTKFQNFCSNIRIKSNVAGDISYRYKRMTKQLNKDFWNTESDTSHSLYVGSYGRDTEVGVSDIDMLFQLPYSKYEQYNGYTGNGQSALLQEVKKSIERTYSFTKLGADGQVIVVPFTDGIVFEVVPVFINKNESFTYPDTNDGGKWCATNPKPEIEAIRKVNAETNDNLKNLCRMMRVWRDKWDVPMGGLLIDTLAYQFIKRWEYRSSSYTYYDWMTRDFFEYLKNQDSTKSYWLAPGSGQYVWRIGNFEYKATRCYSIALEAINYEEREVLSSADSKWREIYGPKFRIWI